MTEPMFAKLKKKSAHKKVAEKNAKHTQTHAYSRAHTARKEFQEKQQQHNTLTILSSLLLFSYFI